MGAGGQVGLACDHYGNFVVKGNTAVYFRRKIDRARFVIVLIEHFYYYRLVKKLFHRCSLSSVFNVLAAEADW